MSNQIKVVVTDYIEADLEWEREELTRDGIAFETHQLKFRPEEEIVAACKDANILVVNMVKMTAAVLAQLPKCKLLIRHGIGYDNIDVPACTQHGIQFAYHPDYCVEDVAEHAIALILACARKIYPSRKILDDSSKNGQWDFSDLFPIYRSAGKKLAILGVGRVGSRVLQKMQAFGYDIIGCDPYLSNTRRTKLQGITWVDKETLFRQADFLTIHTPLNDKTRSIVNADTLALMKPTAYIVNTARGPMIDIPALAAALKEGRLAGAGIDVYDVEPPAQDYPLFGLDNVTLTPHSAWASEEAGQAIRQNILADIRAGAANKNARCVVNKETLR